MSHHLVVARNLSYTYPDDTVALESVSFRITHGESVAVVGANGAGKSTLLLHLNGCLVPQRGTVQIGDTPVSRKTTPLVRQTVGTVLQNSDDQLFMPTVYEDVAFGPRNQGLPPAVIEERVHRALGAVGAGQLRDRPPYKLSEGEKREVAIATVLAMDPCILVMDEPSANLDPKARRRLIGLLAGFTHTKMIATHDLDLVLDLCERTIVLREGRITADGRTADIFKDEALLEESHLEKPLRMQGPGSAVTRRLS